MCSDAHSITLTKDGVEENDPQKLCFKLQLIVRGLLWSRKFDCDAMNYEREKNMTAIMSVTMTTQMMRKCWCGLVLCYRNGRMSLCAGTQLCSPTSPHYEYRASNYGCRTLCSIISKRLAVVSVRSLKYAKVVSVCCNTRFGMFHLVRSNDCTKV